MRSLILIILLYSSFLKAQTTAIPDPNFEQALINLGLDNGPLDGSVPTMNIDTVTSLYINSLSISDITGIEDFTDITTLSFSGNQITILDVTQNTNLTLLNCQFNQLTNLNITQNTALTELNCGYNLLNSIDLTQNINLTDLTCNNNQLTNLNITQNIALTSVICSDNQLTSIDISQNTALNKLWCFSNQITVLNLSQNTTFNSLYCWDNELTCLDVKNGNNVSFINFNTTNNPNLTCIEVDNVTYSTTNWTNIDSQTSFSTNCSNPCIVGIQETNNLKASFYPNPTTGIINIDLGETKTNLMATLSNNLGQIIFRKKYQSVNYINFNIEAPKGIYFLQLETEDKIETLKILKE